MLDVEKAMKSPKTLRELAVHYRRLAERVSDQRATDALADLVARYEQAARDLEGVLQFEAVRSRAYEIWRMEGCPQGRHLEHWHQAEREITGRGTPQRHTAGSSRMDHAHAEHAC